MATECNLLNPHYKELLSTVEAWSKDPRTNKNLKNPLAAAFRLAERDFLMNMEHLKYDINKEVLTKGRLRGFKNTLNTLNDRIESGKLGTDFGTYFWQTSHYGRRDPVIGSYLKDMQQSSFFFRKNELRDRNRFKSVVNFLREDAGVQGLRGRFSYHMAQRELKKLDDLLAKSIVENDDASHSRIQSQINKILKKGELKSFGDFLEIIEKQMPLAVKAKYDVELARAKNGNSKSKKLIEKVNEGKATIRLTDTEIANVLKDIDGTPLKERPNMYKAIVEYDNMMSGLFSSLRLGVGKRIDSIVDRMEINGDIEGSKKLKLVKKSLEEKLMPKYEGQGFFPHYVRDLSADFLHNLMPHLDNLQTSVNPYLRKKTKTIDQAVNDLNLYITNHARPKAQDVDLNYSKHFLSVVSNYIKDINRFNYASHVDAHFINALSSVENIYKTTGHTKGYASNIVDFVTDLHYAANGTSNVSPKMRSLMRTMLGLEFVSKIGINPRSAARNATQRFLDYVEWGPLQIKTMNEELQNLSFKRKGKDVNQETYIEGILKDAGLLFDEISPELLESGVIGESSLFTARSWNESKGKYEFQKKGALDKFADWTSVLAAKSSTLHRAAENSNRKHTFKIAFAQMHKWLNDNPQYAQVLRNRLGDKYSDDALRASVMKISSNYAKNMVVLNHFDYADYAKSKAFRGNVGRFLFQFQHYSMEFLERNIKILREAKDDILSGEILPFGGDARGLEKAARMSMIYFLAPVVASAMTGLEFGNLVEHDTAQRIQQFATVFGGDEEEMQKAFYGKGPVLATFGGPLVSDVIDIAKMMDVGEYLEFVNLDDDSALTLMLGMQEYDLNTHSTDLSKKLRLMNSFLGRAIERHYPQIAKGNLGWAVQQELGLYPTKEAKEIQKTAKKIRKRVLPTAVERSLRKLEEGKLGN